jgi:hypothetical protein
MLKVAYEYGALAALSKFYKRAEEDNQMQDNAHASNPAEQLAQLFQKAEVNIVRPTPDNKTKKTNDPYENEPHWGKPVNGHGGDSLERNVPGFNMPMIAG